jgi:hypothetical protein
MRNCAHDWSRAMIQKSTSYKLIDPSGRVVDAGSAKIIRRAQKRMGKGWKVGYDGANRRQIGDLWEQSAADRVYAEQVTA